jgi:hypothetical protein
MASLQSETDIFDLVLDLLKEQPISSASQNSAPAKWLRRNFGQQRDYLLSRYHWKFAMKRAFLASDPDPPEWGWEARYRMPPDILRMLPLTVDGSWEGTPIEYEEENGFLLCNVKGGLRLRYIGRIENTGLFTNDFIELLSIRLAMKLAHWLTGKQSFMDSLRELYVKTMDEVKQTAAVQVASGRYYDTAILDDIFS